MKINQNFLGGGGMQNKKTFRGRSMDIFWNCTTPKSVNRMEQRLILFFITAMLYRETFHNKTSAGIDVRCVELGPPTRTCMFAVKNYHH